MAADSIRHRTIEANGLQFHIAESGPDDGPLLLCLHGFPEYWGTWEEVLPKLGAAGYHAVAPDQRGYNLSSKPAGVAAYEVPHLVMDILSIGKALSDVPFTLIAHDWGGAAAWATAINAPQALKNLIILNAPHPVGFLRETRCGEGQRAASQYMRLFRSEGSTEHLSANGFEYLLRMISWGSGKPMSSNQEARLVAAWTRDNALDTMLNWYRAMSFDIPAMEDPYENPANYRDVKMPVTVPTLVLWGDADEALRPELLDGIETQVPDLTIKHYPDASHWIIREYPDEVTADILAFLKT